MPKGTLIERFWRKVRVAGPDECWVWTAGTHKAGYGSLQAGKRGEGTLLSHRVSWEHHFGPIPDGMKVLHKCDNRLCINPSHLFLGTILDNNRDMVEKGRQALGEINGSSKLTTQQAEWVRTQALAGVMTQQEIAHQAGITQQTVSNIKLGQRWAGVLG